MTKNQMLLAEMDTIIALRRMSDGPQLNPHLELMQAIEEALADARHRRTVLETAGLAGSIEHLRLNEQIARWELARRRNR